MQLAAFRAWTEALVHNLSGDERVLGLVMLGSASETRRIPDQWSDHDFFVVTISGEQEGFRQRRDWLPDADQIVLHVRETEHGVKVIFRNDHLIEFAVFDLQEISRAWVNDYRVLFDHSGGAISEMLTGLTQQRKAGSQNEERDLAMFLSLLYVGAGRVRRGEILSGQRFIKDFALLHLLPVLMNRIPAQEGAHLDNFDPFRRFERAYPQLAPQLHAALLLEPIAAARALLTFAETHLPDLPADALALLHDVLA
jgi:hypothetical protein